MGSQLSIRFDSDDVFVARFDFRSFGSKIEKTPQGFLKIPATFTRTGVFEYQRIDGTKMRELRPSDEVFSDAHMASLANAPVTLDHPKDGLVNPSNVRDLSIGHVGETIVRQDDMLSGFVIVEDQKAIDKIVSGELKEISLGYRMRLDRTSGEHDTHGSYDQIQRKLVVNHVALGPSGWGRAGSGVGLRLDADGAVHTDPGLTDDPGSVNTSKNHERKDDSRHDGKQEPTAMKEKIKINGIEFEVETQVAQAVRADRKSHDELRKDHESLQGRFDAQAEKLENVEKRLEEANDQERFDSAVAERVALIDTARRVLGADAKIEGSKREIMEQALRHDRENPPSFEGKSDDYVQSRYDALVEDLPTKKAEDSKTKTRKAVHDSQRTDKKENDPYDSAAAQERMRKSHQEAWQAPLTCSRD